LTSKENTSTSRIVTKSQDVEDISRVEGVFDFKFDGMEAAEAGTSDPDNLLVEYKLDSGPWLPVMNIVMVRYLLLSLSYNQINVSFIALLTIWFFVQHLQDGSTYFNGVWYSACFQLDIPVTASTLSLRFLAGGDTGDNDFVSLDNVVLDGKPRTVTTPAPTAGPTTVGQNICSEPSTTWPIVFASNFDVGGGTLFIGGEFYDLIDGGDAQKLPGAGKMFFFFSLFLICWSQGLYIDRFFSLFVFPMFAGFGGTTAVRLKVR
jgi:hypothetical protein